MIAPDPAEGKRGGKSWADFIAGASNATPTPRYDPLCGRCGGPAGPEGAWCDGCIRECREYTLRLDLQRFPELNTEPLHWAAIFYARAGIPVFPLKPGSKVPATARGFKDASTDLRVVRNWWERDPGYNIGIATGHVFDVLDIDTKDGRPGYESAARLRVAGHLQGAWAAALTPSGGRHILFVPSGDSIHGDHASGLDFRGLGGYIVAAPSHTVEVLKPNGEIDQYEGTYKWEFSDPDARGRSFDWAAAMEHLHGLPPRRAPRPSPEYANPGNTSPKRLAGILRKVASTPPGNRQIIAYTWAARLLKEAGYGPAAWDALEQALRDAGGSDHDVRTALRERPGRERVHA